MVNRVGHIIMKTKEVIDGLTALRSTSVRVLLSGKKEERITMLWMRKPVT